MEQWSEDYKGKWLQMDWGRTSEFKGPPNWWCLPYSFSFVVSLGPNSMQPGTWKWALVWTEFQEKLSRSGSEKGPLKTQRGFRGLPPSIFLLSIILYSTILQQPSITEATIQQEPELGQKEAFLSSWWSCDPKRVGWTRLPVFFFLFPIFHHLALWTANWDY